MVTARRGSCPIGPHYCLMIFLALDWWKLVVSEVRRFQKVFY